MASVTIRRYPISVQLTAVLLFCITAIAPIAYMLLRSALALFTDDSSLSTLILSNRQLLLLARSLALAFMSVLVAFVIGFPTAFILSARDLPCRKLCYFFVLVPLLIPPYIMAGAWIHLLSPSGLINRTLGAAFGPSIKLSVFSMIGCMWCLGISFFPIIAIVVAAGLARIDRSMLDVARLNTGRWGVFWHSIVPQITPHLAASICLMLIFSLGRYGVPSLLGVNTFPVEIFAQFSAFYDENTAVIMSIPLVAIVILLILLQRRIMRNHRYVSIDSTNKDANAIRLKSRRFYGFIFLLIVFSVTTLIPFVSVLANISGIPKFIAALHSAANSISTTTVLAILSALFSIAIAIPIANYLCTVDSRFTRMIDTLSWLPIAIPGTVMGLGIIQLTAHLPNLRNNDSFGWLLLCAYIGMFCPFAIRILHASYSRSDSSLADRSALDCPRWYHRLFFVDIPLHLPAIVVSIIMIVVLVVGELNAAVLLIPPGKETMAVSIDNLLHYGANVNASALCLLEVLLVIALLAIGMITFSIGRRNE